jgi:hypothetical protein
MADPIPSADAALLAAQAKAGQAGVDAYKAAQNEFTNQRQQALQQAMQEAGLRGAPAGAMQSLQSTMSAPYDQGIASMSARSADYQAEMGRRDRTLADYNSAVQSARTLIPGQVEMAVAPIRAQSDFNLRSQQIAGDRSVAEIQANTQLALAKMAAAVDAAKRKAAQDAKKENTPTNNELSGLMSDQAAALMNQGSQTVQSALASNVAAEDQATKGAQSGYMPLLKGGMEAQAIGSKIQAKGRDADAQLAARIVMSGLGAALGGERKPAYRNPHNPAMIIPADPVINESALKDFQQRLSSPVLARAVANLKKVPDIAKRYTDYGSQLNAGYLSSVLGTSLSSVSQHSMVDPTTGHRVFLTPQQAQDMSGTDSGLFNYQTLANAPTNVQTPDDYNSTIFGAPTAQNQGQPSPYSSQVMHDALVQSANALKKQGLNIDDAAIAGALPDQISSPYNFLANREGRQASQDVYGTQEKAGGIEGTPEGDKAKAIDVLGKNGFDPNTMPKTIGNDPTSAYNFLVENQGDVQKAVDTIQAILQKWNTDPSHMPTSGAKKGQLTAPTPDLLREALRNAGVPRKIGEYALWHAGF